MKRFSLEDFPLENKTVLLRTDYNVPLSGKKIDDNTRIKASLPTIHFLIKRKCKIVILTHLGRPKGKFVKDLSTKVLVKELQNTLPKRRITFLKDCIGKTVKKKIEKANAQEIFVLENVRFHKEEKENNTVFGHSLALLADVYVNDAFAVSHRKHASIHAVTHFLPSMPGLLIEKELEYLRKALHPRKPVAWLLGGAKLNKIHLIDTMLSSSSKILVGGALCFAFLRAKGIRVGMSKVNKDAFRMAKSVLRRRNAKKIVLPIDFAVTKTMSARSKTRVVDYNKIEGDDIALDIGPKTIELFKKHLIRSRTIIWNGPLGYFEWANFAKGTRQVGSYIGKLGATSICGGAETIEALRKFHLKHRMSHTSTGGGAFLAYLVGEKLPGILALNKNYSKYKRKI